MFRSPFLVVAGREFLPSGELPDICYKSMAGRVRQFTKNVKLKNFSSPLATDTLPLNFIFDAVPSTRIISFQSLYTYSAVYVYNRLSFHKILGIRACWNTFRSATSYIS